MPTPLPPNVRSYVVAATQGQAIGTVRNTVIGDGLVPLASALGDHPDPTLALHEPSGHRLVVTGANHRDLLSRLDVYEQLPDWLA